MVRIFPLLILVPTSFSSSLVNSKSFVLKNIFHVTSIVKNLLNVSQFSFDKNVYFEIRSGHCDINDKATCLFLLQERLLNGLYAFDMKFKQLIFSSSNVCSSISIVNISLFTNNNACSSISIFVVSTIDLTLWHHKLRHDSFLVVKHALSHCNIPFNENNHDSSMCNVGQLAKSRVLSF